MGQCEDVMIWQCVPIAIGIESASILKLVFIDLMIGDLGDYFYFVPSWQ